MARNRSRIEHVTTELVRLADELAAVAQALVPGDRDEALAERIDTMRQDAAALAAGGVR